MKTQYSKRSDQNCPISMSGPGLVIDGVLATPWDIRVTPEGAIEVRFIDAFGGSVSAYSVVVTTDLSDPELTNPKKIGLNTWKAAITSDKKFSWLVSFFSFLPSFLPSFLLSFFYSFFLPLSLSFSLSHTL